MVEIVKNRPQELTRAELEIMQVFWRQGACVVHAILDALEEPKPAYNTVSTIVRILEKKGYVGHKAYGKTYEYYPLVPKRRVRQDSCFFDIELLLRRVVGPKWFLSSPLARRPFDTRNRTNPRHHPASPT